MVKHLLSAREEAGTGVSYKVVRLKNRFLSPLFNGYQDALCSIAVRVPCGGKEPFWHVCEVQLHLSFVLAHTVQSYNHYEYFRAFFESPKVRTGLSVPARSTCIRADTMNTHARARAQAFTPELIPLTRKEPRLERTKARTAILQLLAKQDKQNAGGTGDDKGNLIDLKMLVQVVHTHSQGPT